MKLFNETNYFKNDSEQAFLRSKDLEKVLQITVQDLKQTIHNKNEGINNIKSEIIRYKAATPLERIHQQAL